MTGHRIESLLSPRLYQSPQRAGDRLHDVLKFPNRVRCYTAITDFFAQYRSVEPARAGGASAAS